MNDTAERNEFDKEEPSGVRAKPLPMDETVGEFLCSSRSKPESLLERVAAATGVTVEEIRSRDRHLHIAHARAVACWVIRQHGYSYPSIGKAMRDNIGIERDHTTIISAVRKMERVRANDPRVARVLDGLVNSRKEL